MAGLLRALEDGTEPDISGRDNLKTIALCEAVLAGAREHRVIESSRIEFLQSDHAMNLGLINSAWAQAGRETAFGIRMTKEIGFDTIDIFADPLDTDARERKLIKDECDRAGLPIVSVACVAVGLVDFNPSVQRFHVERVQGVPRHGVRLRGEERPARPGRVHLAAAR